MWDMPLTAYHLKVRDSQNHDFRFRIEPKALLRIDKTHVICIKMISLFHEVTSNQGRKYKIFLGGCVFMGPSFHHDGPVLRSSCLGRSRTTSSFRAKVVAVKGRGANCGGAGTTAHPG